MKNEKTNGHNMANGHDNKPNKMELIAPKIVKLLKNYTIAEAHIALDNALILINKQTKVT